MEQTVRFCLGMERLHFPTIFAKYFSLPQVDFEKRNFCCLTKGGAFDFWERARLSDLIQTRIFINPFIRKEMSVFFSRRGYMCYFFLQVTCLGSLPSELSWFFTSAVVACKIFFGTSMLAGSIFSKSHTPPSKVNRFPWFTPKERIGRGRDDDCWPNQTVCSLIDLFHFSGMTNGCVITLLSWLVWNPLSHFAYSRLNCQDSFDC